MFSLEEEASRFLECTLRSSGWRVRETSSGELVSILVGPCAAVEKVAMDPQAEIDKEIENDLVNVDRRDFLEHFYFPDNTVNESS